MSTLQLDNRWNNNNATPTDQEDPFAHLVAAATTATEPNSNNALQASLNTNTNNNPYNSTALLDCSGQNHSQGVSSLSSSWNSGIQQQANVSDNNLYDNSLYASDANDLNYNNNEDKEEAEEDPVLKQAREAALYAEELLAQQQTKKPSPRWKLWKKSTPSTQDLLFQKPTPPTPDPPATTTTITTTTTATKNTYNVDNESPWYSAAGASPAPQGVDYGLPSSTVNATSSSDSSSDNQPTIGRGATVVGASVLGGVAGAVLLGPVAAVVAAGGVAYAAATSRDNGLVGNTLQGAGRLVVRGARAAKKVGSVVTVVGCVAYVATRGDNGTVGGNVARAMSSSSSLDSSTQNNHGREPGDPFKHATGVCLDAISKFDANCVCDTSGSTSGTAARVAVKCTSSSGSETMQETVKDGLIVMQVVCDNYFGNNQEEEATNSSSDNDNDNDNDNNQRRKLSESIVCIHENFETVEGKSEYSSCNVSVDGKKCAGCEKRLDTCESSSSSSGDAPGFVMQCDNVEPKYEQETLCFHNDRSQLQLENRKPNNPHTAAIVVTVLVIFVAAVWYSFKRARYLAKGKRRGRFQNKDSVYSAAPQDEYNDNDDNVFLDDSFLDDSLEMAEHAPGDHSYDDTCNQQDG